MSKDDEAEEPDGFQIGLESNPLDATQPLVVFRLFEDGWGGVFRMSFRQASRVHRILGDLLEPFQSPHTTLRRRWRR